MPVIDHMIGDITEQTTDVIANPCSTGGGHGEVGTAIGKKWPEAVKNIDVGGDKKRFQLIKVPAGVPLKCKYILHAACYEGKEQIETVLRNAAPSLKANGCKTISLPIFGSGSAGRPIDQTSRELQEVLTKFCVSSSELDFMQRFHVIAYSADKMRALQDAEAAGMQGNRRGAAGPPPTLKPVAPGTKAYQAAISGLPKDLQALVAGVDAVGLDDDDVQADQSGGAAAPAGAAAGGSSGSPQNMITMVRRADNQVKSQIHFIKKK